MALKDILVHVDTTRACQGRIDTAVELARAHRTHLIGLYVLPPLSLPVYAEAEIGTEIIQIQQEAAQNRAKIAESAFRSAAERVGLAVEWRLAEGDMVRTLILHARHADLVVAGQVDRDDPQWVDTHLPQRLVLESGRPALIVPYIGAARPPGKRVLVAWNGSREAARAVNDALPFLEHAESVVVLAVNPPSGDGGHGDIPCADICLHLARHGVNAEAQSLQAEDIKTGDVLLSRAADQDIDLIVLGAYGHSRLREIVLSGVTRHLLQHMTVPVLMSH